MTTSKTKTVARKATTTAGRKKQADTARAAAGKAKHTGTITKLNPIAKEINARFAKADKLDGQADDHRLAAAIQLAEAKKICTAAKLPFKKWVDENVEQSWETARKLIPIGESKDPAAALADMRAGGKARMKKLRDKRKAEQEQGARATTPKQVEYKPTKAATPFERAEEALGQLEDTVAVNVLESHAGRVGRVVMSQAEADKLREGAKKSSKATGGYDVPALQAAFDKLSRADKVRFAEYVADAIGAALDLPLAEADDEEIDLELPDFLDAKKSKTKAA